MQYIYIYMYIYSPYFTLWDPRSVQSLLKFEIQKSGLMVAGRCKIILGLITLYSA
jgi:hypothetical protein